MANKRMFSLQIVDSDAFLEMPSSTQALYFHLGMRADNDGFLNNVKRILRAVNASEDDLKVLLAKRFVLAFDSGVIVIKHWRINNNRPPVDRYTPTVYKEEKALLVEKDNKAYEIVENVEIQRPLTASAQTVNIEENRIEVEVEVEVEENTRARKEKFYDSEFVTLTNNEHEKLITKYGVNDTRRLVEILDNYKGSSGKKYKSDYRTILNWVVDRLAEEKAKPPPGKKSSVDQSLELMRKFEREAQSEQYGNERNSSTNERALPCP